MTRVTSNSSLHGEPKHMHHDRTFKRSYFSNSMHGWETSKYFRSSLPWNQSRFRSLVRYRFKSSIKRKTRQCILDLEPLVPYLVDWKWQNDSDMKTLPTGSYHVPVASIFCIEIIALYCSDFTEIDGMDFTKTCVFDPFRNRLSVSPLVSD